MAHTTTFKSRKVELREQAYHLADAGIVDALYVLAGREEGYVPYYAEYPDEVAAGKRPQADGPGERAGPAGTAGKRPQA